MSERVLEADRWTGSDGAVFRVVRWPAAAPSDTLLLVHHGIGEHAGRYSTWIGDLAVPMEAMGFDARGHGHSSGTRGDAEGLDGLVSDFEALLPRFVEEAGAKRVILYAHSMGGAVIARYLTHRHVHEAVAGVVLSAPAVSVQRSVVMAIKERVGRIAKAFAPTFTLATGLDAEGISSDASQVQRYLDDPLVHDRVSLRLADSLLSEGGDSIPRAGQAEVPALIIHGEADPLIPVQGSRDLAAAWGAPCTLRTFAGRHELHHEVPAVREDVRHTVHDWLMEHMA